MLGLVKNIVNLLRINFSNILEKVGKIENGL